MADPRPLDPRAPAGLLAIVAASAAYVILIFGALAEYLAVYALYQQQARNSTAQSVLWAAAFMVIMAVAGPALAFGRVVLIPIARSNKWILTGRPSIDAQPKASEAGEAAAGRSQPAGMPETGKTSTEG